MSPHPSTDLLERYSNGKLAAADAAPLEEHLLTCEQCRRRVADFDAFRYAMRSALRVAATFPSNCPLDVVHYTADGPVFSRSRKIRKGRWLAEHEGSNLQGGRICKTLREANDYLFHSFIEMFPEHRCMRECGPVTRARPPAEE